MIITVISACIHYSWAENPPSFTIVIEIGTTNRAANMDLLSFSVLQDIP